MATDHELLQAANTLSGELLRRAFEANPTSARDIARAIVEGTGHVALSIIPHKPIELALMFMDRDGERVLLELKAPDETLH